MDIFELMEKHKSQFSSTDTRIYETIRKWPDDYANQKISTIVDKFSVSQSALTRFAKRLGFDGFNVFQYQFKIDLEKINNKDSTSSSEYYGDYLSEVEKAIGGSRLNSAVFHINNAQNVFLAGSNLSNLPAKYLQFFMNIAKIKPSFIFDPLEGIIPTTSRDVFILFSVNSGILFKDYLKYSNTDSDHPYRILITMSKKHALGKYFDEVIVLPEAHLSQAKRTVLPDTLAFFLFCDKLTLKLQPNAECCK